MHIPIDPAVTAICKELGVLQRWRAVALKSRIKSANRLQAIIAGHIGYNAGMDDSERKSYFTRASKIIKEPHKHGLPDLVTELIDTTKVSIDSFDTYTTKLETSMRSLVIRLPVAPWVELPEQRGFGALFLAIIVGEAGDLAEYPPRGTPCGPRGRIEGVAKLWRRLACAPWAFEGNTYMGATWRKGHRGTLPASEWEEYGYNPRRHSISYLVGKNMKMQNFTSKGVPGPYRVRYEESKAAMAIKHDDYKKIDNDQHGMLMAAKLLFKNLWVEWNKDMRGPPRR